MLAFLRDVNNRLAEVTGSNINRGAGYGLEIACTYHFNEGKSFIAKLKELTEIISTDMYISVCKYHNCAMVFGAIIIV